MTVDPERAKAYRFAEHVVEITRDELIAFAEATGQTDPIYRSADAARAVGHRDILVPPTYYYSLESGAPDGMSHLEEIGADLSRLVHGEQAFRFHALGYAGDRIAVKRKISDVQDRAGGRFQALVRQATFTRETTLVAESTSTLILLKEAVG